MQHLEQRKNLSSSDEGKGLTNGRKNRLDFEEKEIMVA